MATVKTSRSAGNPFRNAYIYFALLIPATVFAFWKTYFAILDNLPDIVTPVIHVHASLMTLWLLMLIAQAWFIRTQRFRLHRLVGRSSYVIAPLIIFAGLLAVHEMLNRTPEGVTVEGASIQMLAFGQMVAFAATWGLAMVYRKQTPRHVRFMISTAFAICTAMVFRVFLFWVPGFDTMDAAFAGNYAVLSLLLLVLIAADWRMGVKRSVFWVVTILISVMHIAFWTIGKTDGFLAFCQWYADLPS